MIPTVEAQAQRLLTRQRLSEAECAERAGLPRRQVRQFVMGANVCRETLEKIVHALGACVCGVDWREFGAVRTRVAALDEFLKRADEQLQKMEQALLYFGLPVRELPARELAEARSRIAEVRLCLAELEEE